MYNLVGFQTNLKFPEQKRVFSLIPALHNADFVRYGVMHRNTFLDSPRILNSDFSVKDNHSLFFSRFRLQVLKDTWNLQLRELWQE